MHHIAMLSSSRLVLAPGVLPATVLAVFARHAPDLVPHVRIVADVPDFANQIERYRIEMEGTEVPQAPGVDLRKIVREMGSLVTNGFSLRMRDDSMSDERDEIHYGGPNARAIADFEGRDQVQDALDQLGTSPLAAKARAALQHVLRHADTPDRAMLEKMRADAQAALADGGWGDGKPFQNEWAALASLQDVERQLEVLPPATLAESVASQDKITYSVDAPLSYKQLAEVVNSWRDLAAQELATEKLPLRIAVTVSGGVVTAAMANRLGAEVVLVDFDTEGSSLADDACHRIVEISEVADLAHVAKMDLEVDPVTTHRLFAVESRKYAFAEGLSDWSDLPAEHQIKFEWLDADGVILDMTDPVRPQLALDEMKHLASKIGKPMYERLAKHLENMGIACAKGEDATEGFDERHRKLADLVDAMPWTHDMDSGVIVARGGADVLTFGELDIGARFFDPRSGEDFEKVSSTAGRALHPAHEGETDLFRPHERVEHASPIDVVRERG